MDVSYFVDVPFFSDFMGKLLMKNSSVVYIGIIHSMDGVQEVARNHKTHLTLKNNLRPLLDELEELAKRIKLEAATLRDA